DLDLLNLLSARSTPRQTLQLKIAFNIVQSARRWQGVLSEARRSTGKGGAWVNVLYYLDEVPEGLTQTVLAKRLKVSGPSLTRQLDKLEAQSMVSRRRVQGDGRARLVVMEEAGRAALLDMDVMASAMRDRVFKGVSDEDLATTERVLDALAHRLAKDPGLKHV
ncbi:hypothetical protein LTR94_024878, partial [Friedmanniomyces endolithicus]